MKNTKQQHLTKDLALVVMSCDAYEDVARHFFNLKRRYMPWWKNNCYFINESNPYKDEGVITINADMEHTRSWNERLKMALDMIPEKYILYMQEDYLIDRLVLENDLIDAVKYMEKNHIWYYKIDNLPVIAEMIDDIHSSIPSNKRYGINLLTAIFDKNKLIKLLPKDSATAWEVETSFLKKVTDEYKYDLEGCVLNTKPIISVCYGVRHGKWMRSAIRHLGKTGYKIEPKNRKIMGFKESTYLKITGFISHRLTTRQIRRLKRFLMKFNIKTLSLDK